MSSTFKSALVALIAAVALPPAALGETPAAPDSVRAAYADLKMSTRAGGEILLHRIQSAAKKACAKAV